MSTAAIIGHGRSPEGKRWGVNIDACDLVLRMWDWSWQKEPDYGTKYDYGLFEATPSIMEIFYKHNKREPRDGWIASKLHSAERCQLPDHTELIDQVRWTDIGKSLGGVGATGKLQFTRGTIAACWAIERASRGDQITLVGFDSVLLGRTQSIESGYAPEYRKNLGSFGFTGYKENVAKYGNHDFTIERPVMESLARSRFVSLCFAQDIWE